MRTERYVFRLSLAFLLSVLSATVANAQELSPLPVDRPTDPVDHGVNPCARGLMSCGFSVELGPGPYAGVANENGACAPNCLTARIGDGRYSDFIPVARPGTSRPPPSPGDPGTAVGNASGGSAARDPAAGEGDAAAPEPPPPPPPPTTAEVLATCPDIPDSEIGRDPTLKGLTGLETRLWASPVEARTSETTIRGYPVFCIVAPYRWEWETGDGGFYARTRHGGPHPDNPVAHMYETKQNPYTLQLRVRWQRITNYGSDRVVTTAQEPYQVIEIRSVLTN